VPVKLPPCPPEIPLQCRPAFCVSIHDVATPTWAACEQLMKRLPVLKELPLTLLLVPDWHRHGESPQPDAEQFHQAITTLQASGHELCLHGYTHLDEWPASVTDWWQRRMLTRSEGEFAALDESAARERLRQGQRWLAAHGWRARGFVPPAWMINAQGIRALRDAGFDYLGLYSRWRRLADGANIAAPSITYSTRHLPGDALWRNLQDVLLLSARRIPVLRLALHPADVRRSANLAHAGRLIEQWLRYRVPLTEYQGYRLRSAQLSSMKT
jgi:uncharacterized protein